MIYLYIIIGLFLLWPVLLILTAIFVKLDEVLLNSRIWNKFWKEPKYLDLDINGYIRKSAFDEYASKYE